MKTSDIEVIAIGELLIDMIADNPGMKMEFQTSFTRYPGGAPANFAVNVRRLGINSGVITKIGDDFFGRFLIDTLNNENVDTSNIAVTKEYKTALAFVGLDDQRKPNFSFYRSPCADIMLNTSEISEDYIKNAKFLMYGTVSMADEPVRSAIYEAVKIAKKNGIKVICDPNLREDLWHFQDPTEHLLKVIQDTDIILPSMDEAEFLTGEMGKKAIDALLDLGPKMVCMTKGSEGSLIQTGDGVFSAPAFNVNVVDTTGAGDAFAAGVCVGLILNFPMKKLPYFANAVSAIKIQRSGGMSGPSLDEVQKFLKKQPDLPKFVLE